jgi:bifunctional DNA-binding transcriptional regulator/antitoxin component of YhaV-PrlF toxin-antitoxin module
MQNFCAFRIADKERPMIETTLQVRKRGVVTFPSDLRERYGIREGDSFRLLDVDGIFVLTPLTPMVPQLAREIERLRLEAGLSVEEFLNGLREQRARYTAEKYAKDQPA